MNLKRNLIDMQGQLQEKDAEIDKLKKKMKYTKINELEAELEESHLHLERLRSFIHQNYASQQRQ